MKRKKTVKKQDRVITSLVCLAAVIAAVIALWLLNDIGRDRGEVLSVPSNTVSSGMKELADKNIREKEEAEKKAKEEAERKAKEEEERIRQEAEAKAEAERKAKEEAERKAKEEEEKRAAAAKEHQELYNEYLACMEKAKALEKTLADADSGPSAWNTVLCNPSHALPDGYIDSISFKNIYGRFKVDERIYYNVKAMFLAAELDGIDLSMVSAFRDIDLQTRNFNNKKNYYMDRGMTEEEAYAKTATIIAVPGTSEHHTGLALDILTPSYMELTEGFDRTKAYEWLSSHCTEFGFILRYAKDKRDVTKIIYEPWHYRFVGIENARKITASGLCYEEYLGITD